MIFKDKEQRIKSNFFFLCAIREICFVDSVELKHRISHSERVCAKLLQSFRLFVTPWTVARQAPLSMGFFRQEYWGGFPCPPPWDLPDPGIEPRSPAMAGGFFKHWCQLGSPSHTLTGLVMATQISVDFSRFCEIQLLLYLLLSLLEVDVSVKVI